MSSLAKAAPKSIEELVASTRVLVIDDDYCMRKVIRSRLLAVGIKDVHETSNGVDGLKAIEVVTPDVVILDWEMPNMTGAEFMRIVRSPNTFAALTFPSSCSPAIRSASAWWRPFALALSKPVSAKLLHQRIMSIRGNPRPMVLIGDDYRPEPRKVKSSAWQSVDSYEPVWI